MQMIRTRAANSEKRRGAAAVETALMMPLLLVVTFGSIDIAQYINSGQVVANACREGARVACRATVTNSNEVEDAILNYLNQSMPQLTEKQLHRAVNISVKYAKTEDNENGTIPDGNLGAVDSGVAVVVHLQFDFSAIRWLQGPDYNPYSVKTVCRRE